MSARPTKPKRAPPPANKRLEVPLPEGNGTAARIRHFVDGFIMQPLLFPLLLAANKYRIFDVDLPKLLPDSAPISTATLIVLALIVLSGVIGVFFANSVRMRDYGWRVG